jgi:hypothetical protein
MPCRATQASEAVIARLLARLVEDDPVLLPIDSMSYTAFLSV